MASSEHIDLANFVKSVHQKLRDESKIMGVETAWKSHCNDEKNLKQYAEAMKNLASNHWESSYMKEGHTAVSRVEWVHQFCRSYFTEENISQCRQRETEIGDKIDLQIGNFTLNVANGKYKLLDVGSCYNPFKKYECFDVLPIDIAPATSDVYKCDFLSLKISSRACDVNNLEICELESESFHVVVFCLLLEYMPSPEQRLLCCKKAYELLKPEGILVIITPDSKHVGANAKIMKSWRFILAKIGLSRIKYEKLSHLHCMVFRKSLRPEIAQRWAHLQDEEQFYGDFVIPQDFKKVETIVCRTVTDTCCEVDLFEELPLCEF